MICARSRPSPLSPPCSTGTDRRPAWGASSFAASASVSVTAWMRCRRSVRQHPRRVDDLPVTGHSGAGKSTFLRLLLQLERPSQGAIEVNGVDVTRLPERALPGYRRHLGAVFQDHHLLVEPHGV